MSNNNSHAVRFNLLKVQDLQQKKQHLKKENQFQEHQVTFENIRGFQGFCTNAGQQKIEIYNSVSSLVKENVMLWTHSQSLTDLGHVTADIQATDGRSPGCWREQAGQNRPAINRIITICYYLKKTVVKHGTRM